MERKAKNAVAWRHHRRQAGVTKSGVLSDLGGFSIFALGKTNKQTNTFPDQWVSSEISLVPLILLLIKHLVCATFTTAKIMRKLLRKIIIFMRKIMRNYVKIIFFQPCVLIWFIPDPRKFTKKCIYVFKHLLPIRITKQTLHLLFAFCFTIHIKEATRISRNNAHILWGHFFFFYKRKMLHKSKNRLKKLIIFYKQWNHYSQAFP